MADALGDHLAAGRLTVDEFRDRLDLVFTARTHGELAPATTGLPRPRSPEPPLGVATPEERARRRARRAETRWARFAAVSAGCWAVWGLSVSTPGAPGLEALWPLWVTLPWAAWLLTSPPRPEASGS